MFKVFIYAALALVVWILYSTYWSSPVTTTKEIARSDMQAIVYRKSYCPYCHKATKLLTKASIPYKEIDLDNNSGIYNKLVEGTGQKTVPYIYINSVFIGGFDELVKFLKSEKNNASL